MKKPILLLFALCLLPGVAAAQWDFAGVFPPDTLKVSSGHGLAVDPDGKVWFQPFSATDSVLVQELSAYRPVRVIYVFNPDGTQADFSPIKFLTFPGGDVDTLGGFLGRNANGALAWEGMSGRGLESDANGNIIASQFTTLFRIDYKTGAGINKVNTSSMLSGSITAAAVDSSNNTYISGVVGGDPIAVFDPDFNFIGNAVDSSRGFSRDFEVSADGNTIYWSGYTTHAIYRYTRPDEFSPFNQVPDTLLKGFDSESIEFGPNGWLWASAGSPNDLPNRFPGAVTNYSPNTWYAFNPPNFTTPVDSIKWGEEGTAGRPRGIGFTRDGQVAYVTQFSQPVPALQKFIRADRVAVEPTDELPVHFSLDQNYPNPFNPETRIEFALTQSAEATLKVYDVLGREVATLMDGFLPVGTYSATFDGARLPSGTYLYVLESQGQRLSKTMVLLK